MPIALENNAPPTITKSTRCTQSPVIRACSLEASYRLTRRTRIPGYPTFYLCFCLSSVLSLSLSYSSALTSFNTLPTTYSLISFSPLPSLLIPPNNLSYLYHIRERRHVGGTNIVVCILSNPRSRVIHHHQNQLAKASCQ